MMTLQINNNEYNVEFGFNNFCDSDLLERVQDMMFLLNGAETDADVTNAGKMKELFVLVRELIFEGLKKNNPVDTIQEVGDLLDKYFKETPKNEEGEPTEERGVLALFLLLTNDLFSEGFLADLMMKIQKMNQIEEAENIKSKKIPQDHKRKTANLTKK